MGEDYWEGATWVYQADITNDGSNSGLQSYEVTPGAGNEFYIMYGYLHNGDAAGRTGNVLILSGTGGEHLTNLISSDATVGAADRRNFPAHGDANTDDRNSQPSMPIVSGTMTVLATMGAVAVNQDTQFAITCRIRGAVPTVTLVGPTDAVKTVNVNQVY